VRSIRSGASVRRSSAAPATTFDARLPSTSNPPSPIGASTAAAVSQNRNPPAQATKTIHRCRLGPSGIAPLKALAPVVVSAPTISKYASRNGAPGSRSAIGRASTAGRNTIAATSAARCRRALARRRRPAVAIPTSAHRNSTSTP